MTIAGESLPAVSYCTASASYNRNTSPNGALLFMHRFDTQLEPELHNLVWQDAEPEVVDAVMRHYEAHAVGSWRWKSPKDTVTRTWRYVSAPSINYTSARSASIAVDVERVLAFIPT